jgi:hypothetical protein
VAVGWQQQPGHHAHKGLAVGEPHLGPAQVLVHDSWHPASGDAGIFRLALSISDLSPLPGLLGTHGFHIGNKGARAQASGNTWAAMAVATATELGQAEARGDGIIIAGVIATWGGRCPLSIWAAVEEAAAGRRTRQE